MFGPSESSLSIQMWQPRLGADRLPPSDEAAYREAAAATLVEGVGHLGCDLPTQVTHGDPIDVPPYGVAVIGIGWLTNERHRDGDEVADISRLPDELHERVLVARLPGDDVPRAGPRAPVARPPLALRAEGLRRWRRRWRGEPALAVPVAHLPSVAPWVLIPARCWGHPTSNQTRGSRHVTCPPTNKGIDGFTASGRRSRRLARSAP